MNRKGKSLKKNSVSIGIIKGFGYQKLQHVFECCLSALTQLHNRFAIARCSKSAHAEIRCSGVSSCFCCYGNYAAGSKPV